MIKSKRVESFRFLGLDEGSNPSDSTKIPLGLNNFKRLGNFLSSLFSWNQPKKPQVYRILFLETKQKYDSGVNVLTDLPIYLRLFENPNP